MIDEIFEKFDGAFAENTIRAYRSDFEQYSKWCASKSIPPIPATADNLAMYVDDLSRTCKSATIRRRVNSLGTIFKLSKNLDPTKDPEVILALKRMHRRLGRYQKQAVPLTRPLLERFLLNCSDDLRGNRNRILLLLGYETMLRRSELCSLRFEDLELKCDYGSILRLRKSKTDQDASGRLLRLSCQLTAQIASWKQRIGASDGYVLRAIDKHGNVASSLTPGSINSILQAIQNDHHDLPAIADRLSGHSFRVGAAHDLLRSGNSIESIMIRGGWFTQDTVIKYLRQMQF